jgi:hypothetical protein
MSMPRAYISGPMTGLPHLNFPAFHAAAAALRAQGLDVVNPAELNPDPQADWHACMRTDIKALCDCEVLVLLPGWEDSKGAHLELHLAHRMGLVVKTLEKVLERPEQLVAFWAALASEQAAEQANQRAPLAFLADDVQLQELDGQLAELSTYYLAEEKHARTRAQKARTAGEMEKERRYAAAAKAWRKAFNELARLACPF